ncbi:MAG: hypothetical protein HRT66_06310 [Flavobacteriaceae bacterium]|nr:hypothetical protein [Flavobacteriaceae bacterium]
MKLTYIIIFLSVLSCDIKTTEGDISIDNTDNLRPIIRVTLSENFISEKFKDKTNVSLEEGQGILFLYKLNKNISNNIKVFGRYFFDENVLNYVPIYKLGNDLEFEVATHLEFKVNKLRFKTPKLVIPKERSKVIAVYPSQYRVPYNILSFQFLFSIDMKQTKEVDYSIKIYEGNKEIMWNEKRITWISPGHIAISVHPTGLIRGGHNPRSKVRPAFFKDKKYSIVITDSLYDKYGRKLYKEYKKVFLATAIDLIPPKLLRSKIIKTTDKEVIEITFSETMDYASLILGTKVYDENKKIIKGKVKPTNEGCIWLFVPDDKLYNNNYNLALDRRVIDLANNKVVVDSYLKE